MEHKSLDKIRNEANVTPFEPHARVSSRALRRERLERLATILEHHRGPVKLLSRVEYLPHSERAMLRTDDSPLTIAYRDPVLRGQGLVGDRLGDATEFFDLTPGEAHHLLCDCHYPSMATPEIIAERARLIAKRMTLGEVWAKIRSAFTSW